jgi:lipopolysaccharide export system permease protein
MKVNTIINRYIFKELLPIFSLNLAFFTFIFLMEGLLEITNWIVNYNISLSKILLMILYLIPTFLNFVIPMAVMMSILLTFLRMSNDNEIIALKSGGQSIYALLPPVLLFCSLGFVMTWCDGVFGLPWGRLSIKNITYEMATSAVDIGLKERTFNDSFDKVMLYVTKIDLRNRMLIDVFIEDRRQQDITITVVAPRGQIFGEPGRMMYHIRLFDGSIHQTNLKDRSASSTRFKTYDLNLDLKPAAEAEKNRNKNRKEMYLGELIEFIHSLPQKNSTYYNALLELHRKFSLPAACFALGLLAVPLGIQSRSAKRSFGLIVGFFFYMLYNGLLSFGMIFGESGDVPPYIGMWLPNVVMGVIGLYLLLQTARERSTVIPALAQWIQRLTRKLLRQGQSAA